MADVLTILFVRDIIDGGYAAQLLEIPGVLVEGETKADAIRRLADAYELMAPDLNLKP